MSAPDIEIRWQPAFRIIPTRFPSINLFDRVASPQDFDALYALEAMTNDRIRDELGDIELVPKTERIFGHGCGPIMAAFTHLNPMGSRFSDGSYGVFYAAQEKETAIAETKFHSSNFLSATNEDPIKLEMRVYRVDVAGVLNDAQGRALSDPIYDLSNYSASQAYGRKLREQGANGVCYQSVRRTSGSCIAAFKTTILSNCHHASQLLYLWNGSEISEVYEKLDCLTVAKVSNHAQSVQDLVHAGQKA